MAAAEAQASPIAEPFKAAGFTQNLTFGVWATAKWNYWSLWTAPGKAGPSCRLVLRYVRHAYGAEAYPYFVFEALSGAGADSLSVRFEDASSAVTEPELLVQASNAQTAIARAAATTFTAVSKSALFAKLTEGKPFYVTWFDDKAKSHRSALFDARDALNAFKEMAKSCVVHLDPLLGSPSPAEAEENAYLPRPDYVRKITYFLHTKYGGPNAERPRSVWPPTEKTRQYILKYNEENRVRLSRYLTSETRARLTEEEYTPRNPLRDYARRERYVDHGRWVSFVFHTPDRTRMFCAAAAKAEVVVNPTIWEMPHVLIYVEKTSPATPAKGPVKSVDLSTPNPFSTSEEMVAKVGGSIFDLHLVGGQVKLKNVKSDVAETRFMRALRRASNFIVSGKDPETRTEATFRFATAGFAEAITEIAANCDRKDVLAWIK
ncbi:MAG: hypothetical protein NW215_01495 [Hyphomicrobiales bacterium]|nr:hypothetical protein [Hyphomicrobiales bacterium]